ncbi:MAG TPA: hypothetical protein VGK30_16000 [Candidatus Binatia bacterium]|jgi:hypothetical protein
MSKHYIGRGAAVLAAALLLLSVATGYAQTQGMERRDDRRDNRAGGRAAKQACKAGDEKTRVECRQTKRATKQHGREAAPGGAPQAPQAPQAPAGNPAQ